jgi:hypothetical protein
VHVNFVEGCLGVGFDRFGCLETLDECLEDLLLVEFNGLVGFRSGLGFDFGCSCFLDDVLTSSLLFIGLELVLGTCDVGVYIDKKINNRINCLLLLDSSNRTDRNKNCIHP